MKTFFDSTTINSKHIANRFFVAPMSRVSASIKGVPSREMQSYYSAFAEGGFGGIITEGIYTDDTFSKAYPHQPGLTNQQQVNVWKEITTSVHRFPVLFIAQLMHGGAISQIHSKTKAPSSIVPLGEKMAGYGGGSGNFPIPDEMTQSDIEQAVEGFSIAAVNAFEAGFDGVELHAANGYLLDQFLTPYTNLRQDGYGGSADNRLRIISEIIFEIKKHVPKQFILGLRISEGKVNNLSYRWEKGSYTAREILKGIAKLPVDYLHVAAEHRGWEAECVYEDGTSLTGLAKEILNCPVIANGRLHDLELAKNLLDTNQADFFSIGKYALSNPDFVKKIKNGLPLEAFDSKQLHQNPSLFSEGKYQLNLQNTIQISEEPRSNI